MTGTEVKIRWASQPHFGHETDPFSLKLLIISNRFEQLGHS